jgi:hypothetical protein
MSDDMPDFPSWDIEPPGSPPYGPDSPDPVQEVAEIINAHIGEWSARFDAAREIHVLYSRGGWVQLTDEETEYIIAALGNHLARLQGDQRALLEALINRLDRSKLAPLQQEDE